MLAIYDTAALADAAAMREGRRRPSLVTLRGWLTGSGTRRNEGGAPAPLVVPPIDTDVFCQEKPQ